MYPPVYLSIFLIISVTLLLLLYLLSMILFSIMKLFLLVYFAWSLQSLVFQVICVILIFRMS